jgi:hypothetical protein
MCSWRNNLSSISSPQLRFLLSAEMFTVFGILSANRANAGHQTCKPTQDMFKEARTRFLDVEMFKTNNYAVFNSATDLILTVMPLTIFWTLQMDLKIKLGLAGLLGLSVLYVSLLSHLNLESITNLLAVLSRHRL